jgi:hypothetical protein
MRVRMDSSCVESWNGTQIELIELIGLIFDNKIMRISPTSSICVRFRSHLRIAQVYHNGGACASPQQLFVNRRVILLTDSEQITYIVARNMR